MVEVHLVRKAVEVKYDTSKVEGRYASVSTAPEHGGEMIEKKQVINDGYVALFFPLAFTGKSVVEVRGSKSGSDRGTIDVP